MTFKRLAEFFEKLEKTASRNEMTAILAELFQESDAAEIDKICYLSLGRLAPRFAAVKFNLAEKMMVRILSQAFGVDPAEIKEEFKKVGDLGEVAKRAAQSAKCKVQSSGVGDIFKRLLEIAEASGAGSQERKIRLFAELLSQLDPLSVKYLTRVPLEKLRLGFSDVTILDALSWMVVGDKSRRGDIERAYNVRADVGKIAQIVKSEGIGGLGKVQISLGTPIIPALCQRLPTAEEMITKMCRPEGGQVAVEPKYDGERLQIHLDRKRKAEDQPVFIFTRGLENVAGMFPDLAAAVFKEVRAQSAILDGESIGFNPKSGKLVHFQKTMTRKRKYQIGEKAKEVPLLFFCFDILSKDGQSLLKRPFSERRQILEKTLPARGQVFRLAPQIVLDDPQKLRQFHEEQVKAGLEGVVVKKWEASYEPGRRGYTWVKLKQEKAKHGGGLADTIDGVVMGYYRGEGKRAGFGIGRILVGVRASDKSDQILTLTKVGTGPLDREWVEIRERLDRLAVGERPRNYQVDKNLVPDVWCRPELVVEIEADNVTKSSLHLAKYSLRFPRWLRFRDDKSPQQASTLAEIEKLYQLQG